MPRTARKRHVIRLLSSHPRPPSRLRLRRDGRPNIYPIPPRDPTRQRPRHARRPRKGAHNRTHIPPSLAHHPRLHRPTPHLPPPFRYPETQIHSGVITQSRYGEGFRERGPTVAGGCGGVFGWWCVGDEGEEVERTGGE